MKNYTLLKIAIFLFSVLFTSNAFSQGQNTTQGKDFWVSFGVNANDPVLQVRIVASKNTTVTFTFTESGVSYPFNVSAGEVFTKELTAGEKANVYNSAVTEINSKSLRIHSTENISVFAINLAQHTSDATNVLPVTNYGTSYYHTSYAPVNGAGDGYTIIANEDGTNVFENGALVAALNRGNVYVKYAAATDLTGINVTSNNPIAYFVTNSCVFVPSTHYACDCLFQQMIPTPSWGNNFMVPVTLRGRERVRVIASQDGTTITQTGGIVQPSPGTGSLTLNAGQFVELEATLANHGCFITSDKPVAVASYLAGMNYITENGGPASGDPALALVPPIEQLVSRVAIAPFVASGSSVLTEHHALIVAATTTKNLTTIGIGAGIPTALTGGTWEDHSSGYSFYNIPLSNGSATYFFENPNGISVMGYGLGSYESYYYLAASSARQLNPAFYVNEIHFQDADGQTYCDGPFNFRAVAQFPTRPSNFLYWYIDGVEQTSARDQITWTLPANSLALDVPHTFRMDVYSSTNELYTMSTTFTVIDPQPPVISPAGPVNICPPATGVTLSTSTGASWYQWYNNGVAITGATTNTYFATAAGNYTVEVLYGSCNPGPSTPVSVSFGTSPSAAQISVDGKTICPGNTADLSASSTGVTNPVYNWYTSQTSTTPVYTGLNYTTPALNATTTYYVGVSGSNYCENAINQRKAVIVTVGNSLVPGTIIGSRGVCVSNPYPGSLGGPASSGGSGPYTYQWQRSTDSINWVNISGATGLTYDPGLLTSSTYYRRQTTDPRCGTTPSNTHFVSLAPVLMYWDISSKNNNWNDPINWVSSIGQPLNTVPLACTDVHIPGNSNFYPSLDPAITLRNIYYGEPECRDITYHFGAEVAKPNYLSYRKAYVRYNFGYYNGSTYKTDGDIHSAVPMLRGRWYMLAAPLKKIVTGDFAVGGFPDMWQRGFKTSPDLTPGHAGVLSGEWYVPENNNALEIGAKQNHGVAIWAGEYLPAEIGESDHTNLNTLKGVFEMPYFENSTVSTLHRTHSYNTGTKTSSFSYYYSTWPGLPIEPNVAPGTIVRGNEAYRFVFEDAANNPQLDFKVTVASGDEVMVGNVFLSSLDFHTFYTRNSTAIENYYRLYTNGAWSTYSIGSGSIILSRNIASFQSFVVKTKGSLGGTVDLYFPMSASVTRTNNDAHQLRSSGDASIPHNLLYIKAESDKGESWARVGVNINPDEKSVRQMFIHDPDRKVQVPQVYTLSKDNKMNTIQYEFGNTIEVPFGFKSDTASVVSLSVVNQENLNAESLILVDTRRNKEIDLLAATTPYRFTTEPGQGERFKLIIGRAYAPTGIETNEATDGLKVYTHGHTLYVSASKEIAEVTVSTAQGLTVHSAQSVGQTDYSKDLPASTGMYIVTVKLSTGETKTTKVIVK